MLRTTVFAYGALLAPLGPQLVLRLSGPTRWQQWFLAYAQPLLTWSPNYTAKDRT